MNTCRNCKHWRVLGERASGRVPDDSVRHCMAAPPIADFRWPRTQDTHTCGRWEPLEKEPDVRSKESGASQRVAKRGKEPTLL